MNMFKSNGGFTLVELIVVIAILAILAGIAVPAYSGYISKANEAADLTLLDSVKTAVVFKAMESDPEAVVDKIVVTSDGVVTVTIEGESAATMNISEYVETITFKSNNASFTWEEVDGTAKWKADGPATTPDPNAPAGGTGSETPAG